MENNVLSLTNNNWAGSCSTNSGVTGGIQDISGCTTNTTGSYYYQTYPYQTYPYPFPQPTYISYTNVAPYYEIQIRKVNNGFICLKGGVEYVFETVEKMNKFIAKEMEK